MENCLIEKRDVISSGVKKSSSITQETEIWVRLLIKSHFNRQLSSIYNLYNLTIVFYSFHITVHYFVCVTIKHPAMSQKQHNHIKKITLALDWHWFFKRAHRLGINK